MALTAPPKLKVLEQPLARVMQISTTFYIENIVAFMIPVS